ncbi:sulfotransferase [Lipingzhangella sp. LS1_29]|uniref:Sulfotransferase n=1 Tax=Lipingzhangella rawalii TaxID=2055835 RepID=A0ABU2H3C4_9ACTN|nr:sulfotransferase [Lipingzhangella rawalii]MDS1269803.1 sulfotransferase [Lipingzhangella rawalii]
MSAHRIARSLPPGLKDTGRSLAHRLGQTTRSWRVLPTFLIVGAQRCGTTSLFKALTQHPQVRGPLLRKGVHYFDVAYDRGLDWYRGHFPLRIGTRATLLDASDEPAVQVGESSPYYLFHPLAAERIARDLPQVRLLVALRDPVERAYSAHSHERARGFETEDFPEAIALEEQRLAGQEEQLVANPHLRLHSHQHHAYLHRGQYVEQLERLTRHVPRERIHIVESELLFREPDQTLAGVLEFLGLPPHPAARVTRNNAQPRCSMDPGLRAQLREYFAPHDERLAQWLGRPPAWRQ